ncbi:hypothetical protein R3P38DRAFT_3278278 [Favolaschia claudopus]|uniref:Uncharacterized protein n=1 Tax=Favolaschia claudopus TaxID=2862362 RepID=A0AAW0AIW1_9AGAR
MSRTRSNSISSTSSALSYGGPGFGHLAHREYAAAASWGEPALSDAGSDEQMARAISESKKTVPRSPLSRAYSVSSSNPSTTFLGSGSSSGTSNGSIHDIPTFAASPAQQHSPIPTPRFAADEVIAHNLADSWDTASVHSRMVDNPQYTRSPPPIVIRSPSTSPRSIASGRSYLPLSPTPSRPQSIHQQSPPSSQRNSYMQPTPTLSRSSSVQQQQSPTPTQRSYIQQSPTPSRTSSHRSSYNQQSPTPSRASSVQHGSPTWSRPLPAIQQQSPTASRPLSPLILPTRLRTPSIRSVSSARSAASTASRGSVSSVLSSVTRTARHAPLQTAAQTLRDSVSFSIPSIVVQSPSNSSYKSMTPPVVSSPRIAPPPPLSSQEIEALVRLHTLANSPTRCSNPNCGTLIPPAPLDSIAFPTTLSTTMSTDTLTPLPRSLIAALHAQCPACLTTHCRGCAQPLSSCSAPSAVCTSVPNNASAVALMRNAASSATPKLPHSSRPGSSLALQTRYNNGRYGSALSQQPPSSCPVPAHCAAARALGALASLVAFDRALGAQGRSLVRPGRASDKALVGPLHALVYFLEAGPEGSVGVGGGGMGMGMGGGPRSIPSSAPSSTGAGAFLGRTPTTTSSSHNGGASRPAFSRSETGGSQMDVPPEVHPALPTLIALSQVPAYAAGLLRLGVGVGGSGFRGNGNVDVGIWMARAPAYGAVLRLLRALGDTPACRGILEYPVKVKASPGSGYGIGGGGGQMQGMEEEEVEVESWLNADSPQIPSLDHGYSSSRGEEEEYTTILTLVRRLETARVALLRLAGATTFGPTVETAHALCDGVLYLLLQDVLDHGEGGGAP